MTPEDKKKAAAAAKWDAADPAGKVLSRLRGIRNDIRQNIPDVDAVLGTNELDEIVTLCEGGAKSEAAAAPYLYHDLTPRVLATPRHFAYIKINEGCDHPCTFCVIPQYRGSFRSRRFESVIAEAERLFGQGPPLNLPPRRDRQRPRRSRRCPPHRTRARR